MPNDVSTKDGKVRHHTLTPAMAMDGYQKLKEENGTPCPFWFKMQIKYPFSLCSMKFLYNSL